MIQKQRVYQVAGMGQPALLARQLALLAAALSALPFYFWGDPSALTRFILRRAFHAVLILLAVSLISFFLINQSPGSYLDKYALDPRIPQEWIRAERVRLGLDKPWIVSYGLWMKGIVTELNFGRSFEHNEPVFNVMLPYARNTLLLSFCALLFAWLVAVPLGIIAGYRQYSIFDRASSAIAFLGLSIPEVLLALLALFFAAQTGWFPTGGLADQRHWDEMSHWRRFLDMAHHLVLPTLVLGTGMLAVYMRQMRGQLLEVLRADYVRTARAKGLSERSVLMRHAVRNAINPLITLFGFSLAHLLSGAVLVEQVMSYPGLGQLTILAFFNKDIYLVMADVLVATAMLIAGNLAADILLAWSDPRIKLENAKGE
jgi:peptide/nickel transport system permease protein